MDSITAKRTLDHLRLHLLLDIKPTHLITFNWGKQNKKGRKEAFIEPEKKMAALINALQRRAFGRNWAARTDPPWPVGYGFLEHPESNPHYHFLARLDPALGAVAINEGPALWQKIVRTGQLDVQLIHKPVGIIFYCTKDFLSERARAALFIYSDIRKR